MPDIRDDAVPSRLDAIQREVLSSLATQVMPVSSRHIHVIRASPHQVSCAIRDMISQDLIKAEFEGVYERVISYKIFRILPDGERALHLEKHNRTLRQQAWIEWLHRLLFRSS